MDDFELERFETKRRKLALLDELLAELGIGAQHRRSP